MNGYSPPSPPPLESLHGLHQKIETEKEALRAMQQALTQKRRELQKKETDVARQQLHLHSRVHALRDQDDKLAEERKRLQKMEDELAANWDCYHLSGKKLEKEREEASSMREAFEDEQQIFLERRGALDSFQGEMMARLVELAAKLESPPKSSSKTSEESRRHQDKTRSPGSIVTPTSQPILKPRRSPASSDGSKDSQTVNAVPQSSTHDRQPESEHASANQRSSDAKLEIRALKEKSENRTQVFEFKAGFQAPKKRSKEVKFQTPISCPVPKENENIGAASPTKPNSASVLNPLAATFNFSPAPKPTPNPEPEPALVPKLAFKYCIPQKHQETDKGS